MAGGVFVKEGVVEQDAALGDGAVLRHQGALAQVGGAFVHGNHGGKGFLALLRHGLHCLAVFKADIEILNQLALVGQGLGGIDNALRQPSLGRDEALLRGNVGVEENSLEALFSAAAEPSLGHHAHGQVGAVVCPVVEAGNVEAIEVIAPSLQPGIVLLPGLHRVSIHPGGVKNRLPQFLHRLIPAQLRKQLLGPGHTGDGGNAPLLPVLPTLDIRAQNGVAHLPGLGNLIRPHTLQAVRIFGDEVNPAGQHLAVMLLPGSHPVLHLSHGGNALVAAVELLQRLIAPLHRHLFGLGLVGLIHHHGHKLRLVQVCIDNDLLSLLDIHAAADNQPGIFPQYCFFHRFSS